MSKRDLTIWAAGFFDGEGCVSIGKCITHRENSTGRHTYTSYQLAVIAAQKTVSSLSILKSLFGGSITSQLHQRKFIVYKWKVTGEQAAMTLTALLPYLQVKRAVAEIGLRCFELSSSWRKDHRRDEMYPPEIRQAQSLLYQELRMLNTPSDFIAPQGDIPKI